MRKIFSILLILSFIGCKSNFKKQIQTIYISKKLITSDTIYIAESMAFPRGYAIESVAQDWEIAIVDYHFYSKNEGFLQEYRKTHNSEIVQRAKLKNQILWEKYDSIFKTNSKNKFHEDISEEIQRINLAQEIIDRNRAVQSFLKETYKIGSFVHPAVHFKLSDSKYIWRMWRILPNGANEIDGDGTIADFRINLIKETVEIIKYEK